MGELTETLGLPPYSKIFVHAEPETLGQPPYSRPAILISHVRVKVQESWGKASIFLTPTEVDALVAMLQRAKMELG